MLSQVVINQGNFALQNRAEYVVQTVVHCFSITPINKLKINKITPLSQSPLGSLEIKPKHLHIRCLGFVVLGDCPRIVHQMRRYGGVDKNFSMLSVKFSQTLWQGCLFCISVRIFRAATTIPHL